MCFDPSSLLTFSTKVNCQLQLLPTTVRLALTTHPGEQSLSINYELSENSASFEKPHNQIVPVALDPTPAFACLPTALRRPSGPVQQWIFHQAEQELTTLPGLRYSSGHRKGRLKILSILYSMERCWAGAPFWKRRMERAAL